MTAFKVGQVVWLYGVNDRGAEPTPATVLSVGPKYVTIDGGYGNKQKFHHDGSEAGNYSHYWIRTDEQRTAHEARSAALQRLFEHQSRTRHGWPGVPADALNAIADILDACETTVTP